MVILASAAVGVLIGAAVDFGDSLTWLIQAPLMVLLFVLFLSIDPRGAGRSAFNVRFLASALFLNFVFTPLLAYAMGTVFFGDSPGVFIGLIMLLVTPCTDWYLVFTGMSKGNVELGMSILPVNLVLQVCLMPVYLMLFAGSEIQIPVATLLEDIVFVLGVPLVAAAAVRWAARGSARFSEGVSRHGDDVSLLFLCVAVVAMFASEGDALMDNPVLLVEMFVPLLIFFGLLLLLSQVVGRALRFEYRDTTALTFTSLARNSPLALAIASVAFADEPLASLALVIGPLIELPVLSVVSWALLRTSDRYRSFGASGRGSGPDRTASRAPEVRAGSRRVASRRLRRGAVVVLAADHPDNNHPGLDLCLARVRRQEEEARAGAAPAEVALNGESGRLGLLRPGSRRPRGASRRSGG